MDLFKRLNAAEKTKDLLSFLEIIDITSDIAHEGGKIYAQLSGLGKKIEFKDCLIAATAIYTGFTEIITRNCDHFARVPGLSAIVPEDILT